MKVDKLKKEELDEKTKVVSKVSKPPFAEWILHDKKAFKVTFILGCFGGLIVALGLFSLSLMFDFALVFKILFGGLAIWQSWNTYKMLRDFKHTDMSINDLAYQGKYNKSRYEKKKEQYDTQKSGVAA